MRERFNRVFEQLLLLTVLIPLALLAREELRLDPNVRPTFQAIELNLDANKTDYSGTVRIELEVKQTTGSFRFHSQNMEFERIAVISKDGVIGVKTEPGQEGMILATADQELASGAYTLEIDFVKPYNTHAVGLYRMEQDGQGYIFTQMEAVDARRGFPCWDEPEYKIPFQFTIHIPEGQVAVTNTPVVSEKVADNMRTYVFQKTKPLPTYLLAIAAGPLDSVPITGLSVPGRIYTVKGQSHLTSLAVEFTPPILKAIEEYFGTPYPYAKLDLIAIPEYWPGAMENPGAVTYKDGILLLDPQTTSVGQRRRLAYVTTHELAHMWFGDLVTMQWWDDLWLNESFADWLAEKVTHRLYPQYKVDISALQNVQGRFSSDARPSTKPIRKKVVSAADITEDLLLAYGKGKKVLGMVEQWVGEKPFRKGVISYLQAHAWSNATADDLWDALSKASGKDVKAVLSSFLEQSGYPLVSVMSAADGKVTISQQRFLNYGIEAPDLSWSVPVRLKYSNGNTTEVQTVLFDQPTKTVQLGKDIKWVFPDAGAYGYYRWNIPSDMLSKIVENPAVLTERERVAFLGNAVALLNAGVLGGGEYLALLSGFAKQTEPAIVSTIMDNLGSVRLAFIPDELSGEFAFYVRETLQPALNKFGLKKQENESEAVSLLRPQLIGWLGNYGGDTEVRRYAKTLAEAYMTDPASIDPSLATVALRIAAIDGDRQLFETYKSHFEKAKVPAESSRYLAVLGRFSNVELQGEALKYALEGPLRTNDLFSIPRGISATSGGRDRVFQWMMDNYEAIIAKIPKEFAAFLPYFVRGCSEARLEKARAFFKEPDHSVAGTGRNLVKVSESVTDCVNLRKREGAAVEAYLQRLATSGTR